MFSKWFLNLPWNVFDTIINLFELLVVLVPAIFIFIYYKILTLSVWVRDITAYGTTLVIHNKSNKSIFITDIQVIKLEGSCFENPCIMWNDNIMRLRPDDYTEVVINYNKTGQTKQSFTIIVKYNQKEKKVKVTV